MSRNNRKRRATDKDKDQINIKDIKVSVLSEKEIENFKLKEKDKYEHVGTTKVIHPGNFNYLNDIVNHELLCEENGDLPFVVLNFTDSVRPLVTDQHIENLLRFSIVPEKEESGWFPTIIKVGNLMTKSVTSIGVLEVKHDNDLVVQEEENDQEVDGAKEPKEVDDYKFAKVEHLEFLKEVRVKIGPDNFPTKQISLRSDPAKELDEVWDNFQTARLEDADEILDEDFDEGSQQYGIGKLVSFRQSQTQSRMIFAGELVFNKRPNDATPVMCPCTSDSNHFISNEFDQNEVKGKNYLHLALSQETNSMIPSGLSPENHLVELCRKLFKLKDKTYKCCYPIIQDHVRFEQFEGGASGPFKLDLPAWENVIRSLLKTVPGSGIGFPWSYLGLANTLFMVHVEDYMAVNSVNILLYGKPKVWIFIHPSSKKSFESFLVTYLRDHAKKYCDGNDINDLNLYFSDCYPGHKNTFVHPALLRKANIKFKVVVQRIGDMIITKKGSYHMGFNTGLNFAVTQNMIFDDYVIDSLKKFQDPFLYRPYCPAAYCLVRELDDGKESKTILFRFVHNFLKKILEHDNPTTSTELSSKLALWLLSKMDKNCRIDARLNREIQTKIDTTLQRYERENLERKNKLLNFICPVISSNIETVTYLRHDICYSTPQVVLKVGPKGFSPAQLKKFLTQSVFENITVTHYNSSSEAKQTKEQDVPLLEIYKRWNGRDKSLHDIIRSTSERDDIHHPQDLRVRAKQLLVTQKSKQVQNKVSVTTSYLYLNPSFDNLVYLHQAADKSSSFFCRTCLHKKNRLKEELQLIIDKALHKNVNGIKQHKENVISIKMNPEPLDPSALMFQPRTRTTQKAIISHQSSSSQEAVSPSPSSSSSLSSSSPRTITKTETSPKLNGLLNKGVLKTLDAVQTHLKKHESWFFCAPCIKKESCKSRKFKGRQNAINHYRTQHETWNIFCPFCDEAFNSPFCFNQHLTSPTTECIRIEYEEINSTDFKIHFVVCPMCDARFADCIEFLAHNCEKRRKKIQNKRQKIGSEDANLDDSETRL